MERNDKRLVATLAGALGCALLAIAFLLGRLSAKPADAERIAASHAKVATSASDLTSESARSDPAPALAQGVEGSQTPVSDLAAIALIASARAGVSVAGTPTAGPSLSPGRPEIAAYFTQFERLDDMGAGDPQAFAASMLQSVTSGDFSSFDDLLARARAQRERLRALTPPRACLEHYRLALALSVDSVSMLERLKAALTRGDSAALMTIATEGRTLETQTNQLKAMGDTIRRQAGN